VARAGATGALAQRLTRESVNVIAWAAENGSVVTRPNASRVQPLPTGTRAPVCHQSTWPISPGRYVVRWKARAARKPGRTLARCSVKDRDPALIPEGSQALPDQPWRGRSGRLRASPRSSPRRGQLASPPGHAGTGVACRERGADQRYCGSSRAPGRSLLWTALHGERADGPRPSPPPGALLPPSWRASARSRVPASLVRGAQVSTGEKRSVFGRRRQECGPWGPQ